MNAIVEIEFNDCKLVVEGTFIPQEHGDYDTPGTPSEFEIETVFYEGIEVTRLMEDRIEELADLAKEEIEE